MSHELIEHHGQIVAKFVAIVSDFVDSSAGKLRAVDWDRSLGGSQLNGLFAFALFVATFQ